LREPAAGKRAVGLFCIGLLAATLAPVAQNWAQAPSDEFPFSYYPMFSRRLGETYRVTHVVGIDRAGREHVVPYRYLGSGGFNQVRVAVERAARHDPRRLCERVAVELGAHADAELAGLEELAIRSGAYVLESFYTGRLEQRSGREHARCRVAR
jgi:hypothetical protein